MKFKHISLHKPYQQNSNAAVCDHGSAATQCCDFADRGMQVKHIRFHKPYQQNRYAAVCDHTSVATQHCHFADPIQGMQTHLVSVRTAHR